MSKTKKIIFISVALFLLFGYTANLFLSKEALAILYKVINFVVMILVITYVLQKFQLPIFREKIAQKFSFFKGLEDQFKDLKEQNIIATKEITDQGKLFEHLKSKIHTWSQARELQWEERRAKLQKINEAHKKRINIQTQNIHQQRLIKEIFPRVINGTSQQLKQKFKQDQESKVFLKDIISYMHGSLHEQ